jgi:hypothetical protein
MAKITKTAEMRLEEGGRFVVRLFDNRQFGIDLSKKGTGSADSARSIFESFASVMDARIMDVLILSGLNPKIEFKKE